MPTTDLFNSFKNSKGQIIIIGITIIASIIITIQLFSLGLKPFEPQGQLYTFYNNYIIFKSAFFHLINGIDLFVYHPTEHWDLYKYTPTFALFFGGFAILPDWLGLTLWNLLNALILFLGINALPRLNSRLKILTFFLVFFDLITNLQNSQSNALIVGLILLGFSFLEKQKTIWAMFFLTVGVFIKLYSGLGLALLLIYPNKLKNLLFACLWILFFAALPLLVIDIIYYQQLIKSYLNLLIADQNLATGYSIHGILNKWFGLQVHKMVITGFGILLLGSSFLKVRNYQDFNFRINLLAIMLIWLILFNHMSESPTFVIATTGVAVWYAYSSKTYINIFLVGFVLIFTSLNSTFFFPDFIRNQIPNPYLFKVVPCLLVFVKIHIELNFNRFNKVKF